MRAGAKIQNSGVWSSGKKDVGTPTSSLSTSVPIISLRDLCAMLPHGESFPHRSRGVSDTAAAPPPNGNAAEFPRRFYQPESRNQLPGPLAGRDRKTICTIHSVFRRASSSSDTSRCNLRAGTLSSMKSPVLTRASGPPAADSGAT
jgi:hypothetical protein